MVEAESEMMEEYYDGQDLLVSAFNKGVRRHNCHWPTVRERKDICDIKFV